MASLGNNPLINYLKESKNELQKVTWPSRKTVLRDTFVVVGVSVALAAILGAIDYALSYGLQTLIVR